MFVVGGEFQRVAALGQGEGRDGGGGVPNLSPRSEPQLYFLREACSSLFASPWAMPTAGSE